MTKAHLAELLQAEIAGVVEILDPTILYNYDNVNLLDLSQEEQVTYLTKDTMVNLPETETIEAAKRVVSIVREQFAIVAVREGELAPIYIFSLTLIDCLERAVAGYEAEEATRD